MIHRTFFILINIYIGFAFAQDVDIKNLKNKIKGNNINERLIKDIINSNDIILNQSEGKKKIEQANDQTSRSELIEDLENVDLSNISNNQFETSDDIIDIDDSKSKNNENIESEDIDIENDGEEYEELGDKKSPLVVLDYYGYDIFKNDPKLFQSSNLESSDPDHLISPGDEIIIMIWGQTEINQKYNVSKDGYIFIDDFGQLFVNGLTLKELEKKIFRQLKKVYSSLGDGKNATSYLDVSLGGTLLRPKRVFALGEVKLPGAYETAPSTSLFTSLFYFNGPTVNGSLRDINLLRDNKKIGTIDFYSYLNAGEKINDIKLQKDDIVFIPIRGKTISAVGEINRPAIYELKEDEGLKDLIDFSGGLKSTTYTKRVQIERIIPFEKRLVEGMDRAIIDVNITKLFTSDENFELYDGDKVTFFPITDSFSNVVNIVGEVQRPGSYELKNSMKVSDLIYLADGLKGSSFRDRASLTRLNEDLTLSFLTINLDSALSNYNNHNIKLKPNDELLILNYQDMRFKSSVKISGHVFSPGIKPFKKGMTILDLIEQGGGFENSEHINLTYMEKAEYVSRKVEGDLGTVITYFNLDSILAGKGIANNELKMGDEIVIYSRAQIAGVGPKSVKISGYAKRPGIYTLHKNLNFKDLLTQAGVLGDSTFTKNLLYNIAHIYRQVEYSTYKQLIKINLKELIDDDAKIIELQNNDEILIFSKDILKKPDFVSINGTVQNPGRYNFKEGMSVLDLILESGGFSELTPKYIAEIARVKNTKNSIQETEVMSYEFLNNEESFKNLDVTNRGRTAANTYLKADDILNIRSDPYFSEKSIVNISGAIYYPGDYVLQNSQEKLSSIIERSGGLNDEAYPDASIFIRNNKKVNLSFKKIVSNPRSKLNFNLLDGDSIIIKTKPNIVSIVGEVNSPGDYQYMKGFTFKDYIKFSGGFSRNASKYSSYVVFPNGKSKQIKFLSFDFTVPDGSTIYVGTKQEAEKFSFTEYVSTFTDIYTDLLQAYLLISLATQSNNN